MTIQPVCFEAEFNLTRGGSTVTARPRGARLDKLYADPNALDADAANIKVAPIAMRSGATGCHCCFATSAG